MKQPGDFRIVDKLQVFGKDIHEHQLRYHRKRILVSKEFTFDAAHHLHQYEGKCKNLHGHTYKVVFGISGIPDNIGLVIDFGDIKDIWKNHIEPFLDHRYINETLPPMNTSAENMVYWIFEQMSRWIDRFWPHLRVEFVRLFETPTSYAEFRREWMNE